VNKPTNAAVACDVEEEKPRLTLVESASEEVASEGAAIEAGRSEREAGTDPESAPRDRAIRFDSLGIAMLDHLSLLRVFRDQLRMRIGLLQSELGGGLSLEEAIEAAVKRVDDEKATELFERLLTTHTDTITFSELLKLWQHSPPKAELIWLQMKEEAHADFVRPPRINGLSAGWLDALRVGAGQVPGCSGLIH